MDDKSKIVNETAPLSANKVNQSNLSKQGVPVSQQQDNQAQHQLTNKHRCVTANSSKKYRTKDLVEPLATTNIDNNNNASKTKLDQNKNSGVAESIQLKPVTQTNSNVNKNETDPSQVKIEIPNRSDLPTNTNFNKDNAAQSLDSASKCRFNICSSIAKIDRKALKRPIPCIFAWILLVGATGVYYFILARHLFKLFDNNLIYWSAIISAQSLIFIYVVINFVIATFRDPGKYPKTVIAPDDPNFNDDTKSPLYKVILIKNVQTKLKWCSVCKLFYTKKKLIRKTLFHFFIYIY
jgi:hypothetical protein